ncbi:hypothetical protein HYR54_02255 [Candidatus Acetothermia bacterium]|nr:hypothetical protein [Candidatus Acetothermia bacterium]
MEILGTGENRSQYRKKTEVTKFFGAILLQFLENKMEAYQKLKTYLPFAHLDENNSSDFVYQINRRKDSVKGIKELKLNRLANWSALELTMIPTGMASIQSVSSKMACRLEMDINTVPEFPGPLPQDKIIQIFEELVLSGKEIAAKGDLYAENQS